MSTLIYLMRHGIAVAADAPDIAADADRPLTPRGAKRVREVARGLRALGVAPGLVLTSPLVRALQTADLVARELDVRRARVRTTDGLLPGKNPRRALAEALDAKTEGVLCVGHAPHLDRLIGVLLGMPGKAPAQLKKAGVACLELDGNQRATLRWLLEPKMLRKLGG